MSASISFGESSPFDMHIRRMEYGVDTGKRIKYLRTVVLGITSQSEFATPLGVTRGAVGNWELGKGIKHENLLKIADRYRVSAEWLGSGRGQKPMPKGWDPAEPDPHPDVPDDDTDQRPRAAPRGDIPNLNIHAGMGPGGLLSVSKNDAGEIYSDQSDGFWSFPDAVKAGWRNRPHVYAMPVTGDSMEPTLRNGSFVFVDTTHTVPSPEDIYAIDYGDGLMIKRVKMVPRSDKILIMSDNERYGTDELLREQVTVYGRVVAWFQWRG